MNTLQPNGECEQCGIDNMATLSKFVGRQERPQKQPEEKWQDDLFLLVIPNYIQAVCVCA